jgi:hypothetical protein
MNTFHYGMLAVLVLYLPPAAVDLHDLNWWKLLD